MPYLTVPTLAAAPAASPVAAPAAAPAPAGPPSASALMGLQPPAVEAPTEPRQPDVTVSPFADEDPAEVAALAAEIAPAKAAAAVHAQLTALGVEPALASFYQQRVASALSASPPTTEEKSAGIADAMAELTSQYGDRAPGIIEMAHDEARLMAQQNPQITEILRNTHLGFDTHTIKSLASRNYNRRLASLGYKVGQ